jgi:hypothetical protein
MQAAGFGQVMLKANDLVGHPQGWKAPPWQAVRASGLRGTGFQVLRDFEGLSGHLHQYKVDIAKPCWRCAHELGCRVLLACSSTSTHASQRPRPHRWRRTCASWPCWRSLRHPHRLRGLSWGRTVNEFTRPGTSSAAPTAQPRARLRLVPHARRRHAAGRAGHRAGPDKKIFLVQLSDFMWQEIKTFEERMATARTFRVFPGEGVHTARRWSRWCGG